MNEKIPAAAMVIVLAGHSAIGWRHNEKFDQPHDHRDVSGEMRVKVTAEYGVNVAARVTTNTSIAD